MKNRCKRLLVILIAICSLFSFNVLAQTSDGTLVADEQKGDVGETIVIPVSIQNNPGVMGLGIDVAYDKDVFETPVVTRGGLLASGTFNDSISDTTDGSFKVLWSNTSEITEDGTMFAVSLTIKGNAPLGESLVTFSNRSGDTFDEGYTDVSLQQVSVPVEVKALESDKVLQSIEVVQVPDKTVYEEGEKIDSTGLLVKALYNDETYQMISDYQLDLNEKELTLTDTEVIVSYIENGVYVKSAFSITVQKKASTNGEAASIAIKDSYTTLTYVGEEVVGETHTKNYSAIITLETGTTVEESDIIVFLCDETATVKNIAKSDSENWIITITAQNENYIYVYTLNIIETENEADILADKVDAAKDAIERYVYDSVLNTLLDSYTVSELTEDIISEAYANYMNTIPEIIALGVTISPDDILEVEIVSPVDGTADNVAGTDGYVSFWVDYSDDKNDFSIITNAVETVIEAKAYEGTSSLSDVQTCRKLLESKRVVMTQANQGSLESVKKYLAELYSKVLADAGYDITIRMEDVLESEYVAPVTGSLDNPKGTDGYITYEVKISSGNSIEITAPKVVDIDATEAVIYAIAATSDANGSISPAGMNSVIKGGTISFKITPNSGYEISDVLVDQVSVGKVYSYTFKNVQAAHTILVTFKKICTHRYISTKTAYLTNGGIDWQEKVCIDCKHKIKVYYRVAGVSVGDVFEASGLQYKVTSNCTYNAKVKLIGVADKNISTIKIPETVTYKGAGFNVTEISYKGFNKLKKFKKLVIEGDGVSKILSIPSGCFANCKKLKTVTSKRRVKIGSKAFYKCTALTEVDAFYATTIGDSAFYGCKSLKSADIWDADTIGKKAFYKCVKLKDVESNSTTIGAYAFYGCKSLEKIQGIISVKKIGDKAFMGCVKLKYYDGWLQFSEDLQSVGKMAFYNCKKVKYIILSDSKNLEKVGSKAFYGVNKNAEIVVPDGKLKKFKKILKGSYQKTNKIIEWDDFDLFY